MKPARNETKIAHIREKILENALEIIADKGLDGLTMRGLAAKTHMTAPNLYNFFSNKDAIYIHIVIRGFEMLHANLAAAARPHHDPTARARAMIDAYMAFGMNRQRYYDVMFSRPRPKYNGYVGTSLEKIAEIEYRLSADVTGLALRTAKSLMGEGIDDDTLQRRLIKVWSLLHGMITLKNSRIMDYVTPSADQAYQQIINDIIVSITARPLESNTPKTPPLE